MANDVSRLGWRKGLRAWAPALLWSLLIFWLSAIPGDALPQMPGWWNADKLIHGAVYAVLGALCWYGARGTLPRVRGPVHQVIAAGLITTLYGISDEMHQSFTPRGHLMHSTSSLTRSAGCWARSFASRLWHADARMARPSADRVECKRGFAARSSSAVDDG